MEQNYEQNNSIQPFGVIPEQEISIQPLSAPTGVTLMFSIGGTLLGLISGPGAAAVSILGTVVNLLWPDSPSDPNVTWNEMMAYTSKYIDQQLDAHILETAEKELNALKSSIDNYFLNVGVILGPITPLNETPIATLIDNVIEKFDSTFNNAFTSTSDKNKVALLPSYAQAANLNLLFLSQVLNDRKRLNISDTDFKRFTNALANYTKKHIDYCTDVYKIGLSLQKEKGWTYFNKYRRDMTLAVLDIISLFPNYDPSNYNPTYYVDFFGKRQIGSFDEYTYSKPVKTEFTREIYSDVVNDDAPSIIYSNHDLNEMNFIRPPHIFTWLKRLKFVKTSQFFDSGNGFVFLCGHQNAYSFTQDLSSEYTWGKFFGQGTDYPSTEESFLDIPNTNYVYQLNVESYKDLNRPIDPICITKMNFSVTNGYSSTNLPYNLGGTARAVNKNDYIFVNNDKDNPGPSTYNNYSHILSHMGSYDAYGGNIKRKGYIFAFTHSSVDPTNALSANRVTCIPAVKSYTGLYELAPVVVKGPPFTGGDLVKLSDPTIKMKFMVNPDKSVSLNQKYSMRIRYTCPYDTQLKINIDSQDTFTINVPASTKNEIISTEFKYKDFAYFTLPNHIMNKKSIISINTTVYGSKICIDRIEFIPFDDSKDPITLDPSYVNNLGVNNTFATPFAIENGSAYRYKNSINLFELYNANSKLQIRYRKLPEANVFSYYYVDISYAATGNTNLKIGNSTVTLNKTLDTLSQILEPGKIQTQTVYMATVTDTQDHILEFIKPSQDSNFIYITDIKFRPSLY